MNLRWSGHSIGDGSYHMQIPSMHSQLTHKPGNTSHVGTALNHETVRPVKLIESPNKPISHWMTPRALSVWTGGDYSHTTIDEAIGIYAVLHSEELPNTRNRFISLTYLDHSNSDAPLKRVKGLFVREDEFEKIRIQIRASPQSAREIFPNPPGIGDLRYCIL